MKKILGALGALALLSPLAAAVPWVDAAPSDGDTVTVRAAHLERGPDIAVPHVKGRTIIDGDVRVRVDADWVFLLGASGDGYVVDASRDGRNRIVLVTPDGEERALIKGSPAQVRLSSDGETLAVVGRFTRRSVVRVHSAADGALLAREKFGSYPAVLDVDDERVIVAGSDDGAIDYDYRTDTRRLLTEKFVYAADLATDRLAYFTSDPWDDGCSVVTRLARPTAILWRSCEERVHGFSPDGARIATVHKMSDGAGPGQVWQRSVRGRLIGSYRVRGYFGAIRWESTRDLLLDAWGRKKGATVRCSSGSCERATAVRPTPEL